jgi:Asp-tRNA(Asn)/Glu-tRNA(Gln) amidotransferase A subunit family amidase
MEQAKRCDQQRQEAIEDKKVEQLHFLHGIPFSVKDFISIKDSFSTCGCAALTDIKTEYSKTILPLIEAGAIPLVKGNIPPAAMSIHAKNFVWGEATNIYNNKRSPGGSSGGDGGLVSSRCIPFGFGTDVGGSIRIPAHFNGI